MTLPGNVGAVQRAAPAGNEIAAERNEQLSHQPAVNENVRARDE